MEHTSPKTVGMLKVIFKFFESNDVEVFDGYGDDFEVYFYERRKMFPIVLPGYCNKETIKNVVNESPQANAFIRQLAIVLGNMEGEILYKDEIFSFSADGENPIRFEYYVGYEELNSYLRTIGISREITDMEKDL